MGELVSTRGGGDELVVSGSVADIAGYGWEEQGKVSVQIKTCD